MDEMGTVPNFIELIRLRPYAVAHSLFFGINIGGKAQLKGATSQLFFDKHLASLTT